MQASEGVTKNDKFPSVTERSAALPLTGVMHGRARRALHSEQAAGIGTNAGRIRNDSIPQGEPGGA
jgi:hypothetical protein